MEPMNMAVRQPVRKKSTTSVKNKKPQKKRTVARKSSPKVVRNKKRKYGTSKLETYFAHEFLDKLGLRYIYEYEAKDIGRFYDFAIVEYDGIEFLTEEKNGVTSIAQKGQNVPVSYFIEIDGSFFHGDPRVLKEGKLNKMQKYNQFIDSIKDMWCASHGYPLLRIWEYDIRHNPKMVMEQVLKYVTDSKKKQKAGEWRKKPH